jgi:hypothetical protein
MTRMSLLLLLVLQLESAEIPGYIAKLRSPIADDRVAGLLELSRLKGRHEDLLEPVADALLDEVPEVRGTAALALSRLATELGCKPSKFLSCTVFARVFDKEPVPLAKVRVPYSQAAQQARVVGYVTAQLLIREDGLVSEVEILRGHPLLSDPLLPELHALRYQPARRKGRPVAFVHVLEVYVSP